MTIDFEADSKDVEVVGGNAITKIANLAEFQTKIEDEIEDLEGRVKELKAQHQKVSTVDLPEALTEIGMGEVPLSNGNKVKVKPFYRASIPAGAKGEESLAWLRDNGHGDLIKNQVKTDFGKDEDAKAAKLLEDLKAQGYNYTAKESVHTQTLQAWLREQLTKGEAVPLEMFNGFIGQKATIERAE